MNREISKLFQKVIINSLNPDQIEHLGGKLFSDFDIHKELGISRKLPIQRQNAAEILVDFCKDEEEIVQLFTILLQNEGHRFYGSKLKIWEVEKFILLLKKHKWVFDRELFRFFRDPFYENEINLLNKLKIIDLREEIVVNDVIGEIKEVSKKMSVHDLEWRITLRLYDLEENNSKLIRKIIELIMSRQNLKAISHEIFFLS